MPLLSHRDRQKLPCLPPFVDRLPRQAEQIGDFLDRARSTFGRKQPLAGTKTSNPGRSQRVSFP